jgi:hypothetical protein
MDPSSLIPSPDTIPAPAWLFLVLDLLTFLLHILVINVVLGGSLMMLFARFGKRDITSEDNFFGALINKVPTSIALGVNLGVAPLLFLQVIYGHLFYTSSVLMGIYWILVIPLLIIAYYGAYVHVKSRKLARISILITSLILLYIGFMQVNNLSLMTQPAKWSAYFGNRGGTILNVTDPVFIPRYLHFLAASVAVAGLFTALVWSIRTRKEPAKGENHVRLGLRIFGYATIVQIVAGLWLLMAIPSEYILQFMGQNVQATIVLLAGFLAAIGALVTAFLGKLRPTIMQLLITLPAMVITRQNLRTFYLQDQFHLDSLNMIPQYGVLILFLVIFAVGLWSVWYMVKAAIHAGEGRAA